ncbi:spherulation-specific family 4 protein [Chamaesiphon sp. OTE_8_metabat_110]|uniref:spherulation-specific family 4 protein n=1 Tax=Chamaesiphon sp. OTE_8_metabat_110 TaxID=2964696 RepID=UPI00286A3F76|nr:spherulation-specific family 4 protein [Chamaesiphon sp. OTE_8_metabat_110]
MRLERLLIAAILTACSIGCTSDRQQQLSKRSDRIDLTRMQITSKLDRHSKLQILLPLYIYPNWYDKNNYIWKQVIAAANQVPIVAIINPNNGPNGMPPNVDYQQGIKDLHQAGIKIIGYVPSNYAKRDLLAIEADIDLYIKYFNVQGIFIDEAANTPEKLNYYHRIYRYIKSRSPSSNAKHSSGYTVTLNPGTAIDESYLSKPVADTIVLFENKQKNWQDYQPPAYVSKYSPQHFATLIHTTTNRKLMKNSLDRAAKSKFGYVYITNDSTDTANNNPWDTLPSYWQAEVNYIQQLNNLE